MSWKKMFVGEKMPDKNDPKYHDRYEKEVAAGREFARMTKIDKVAAWVQRFANRHTKLFLGIIFTFIFLCFGFNIYRISHVWNQSKNSKSAIERQEELVRNRHQRLSDSVSGIVEDDKEYQVINQNNNDNGHKKD